MQIWLSLNEFEIQFVEAIPIPAFIFHASVSALMNANAGGGHRCRIIRFN